MKLLSQGFIALVALLHLWFMILEMFLWSSPYGRKAFGMSQEKAMTTKVLAQNQGLYNGFLAAGLLWGILSDQFQIQLFFLSCVFIAGCFGAYTVSKKIFWFQALPALLALILIWVVQS